MAVDLGQIQFAVGVDTSQLDDAFKSLEKFQELAEKTAKSTDKLNTAQKGSGKATRGQTDDIEKARRALRTFDSTLGGARRANAQFEQAQERLNSALRTGIITQDQFNDRMEEARRRFSTAEVKSRDLRDNMQKLADKFSLASIKSRGLSGNVQALGRSVRSATGAFVALAGVAVAGKLTQISSQAVAAAADLKELSQRAGVTTTELQKLEAAATEFGVSNEALVDGLKELQNRAAKFAKDGGGEAAEAFDTINVSQDKVNRNLNDNRRLFLLVVQSISELESKAAQVRVAEEIFGGQAGEQFLTLIRAGKEEIVDTGEEAAKAGRVLEKDVIERADDLRDRFNTIASIVSKTFQSTIIKTFGGEIKEVAKAIQSDGFQQSLQSFAGVLVQGAKSSVQIAENIGTVIDKINNSNLGQVLAILQQAAPPSVLGGLLTGELTSNVARRVQVETGGVGEAKTELQSLVENVNRLNAAIKKVRDEGNPVPPAWIKSAIEYEKEIQALLDPSALFAERLDTIQVRGEPIPSLLERMATQAGKAKPEIEGMGDASDEASVSIETLNEAALQSKPAFLEMADGIREANEAAARLRESGAIEPGTGRVEDTVAARRQEIRQSRQESIARAKRAKEVTDNIKKGFEDAQKELSRFERSVNDAFEQMNSRIQDTFADTFKDLLDGSIDSFKDFGDEIIDIWKSTAAEIAAAAIVPNITPAMGSGAGGLR